jgi:amino acid adenylation domain-containing protein/thioester reductase-like protein
MSDFIRLFDQVASERRDASAVVARDATLSFFALRSAAQRLAEELHAAGLREGDVVALSLGRTSLHVVGMLAAWYAKAAFLPIDPTAPEARVRALLGESRARVLLSGYGALPTIRPLTSDQAPLGPEGDDLAYVIYTSGSTGRPKGVRVGHRGLCPVLLEQIHAFGLAPGKRALLTLSTAFDASISDIGTSLLSGATLVIAEEAHAPAILAERLRADAITHADLPPSLLPLVDPATLPSFLETVAIGGEVCPPHAVRAWARRVRVINVYGPTEATICTSLCSCDGERWTRPLLGDPLAHVEYLVDEGELLIAGPALALGYIDRPALEAQRFVERGGKRWYRTGDLVRQHDDGLEFVGRLDRQIKVRGRLVCPEELEMRLRSMDGVAEAVVEPAEALDGTLHAWVVPTSGAPLSPATLRQHLETELPAWMIPGMTLTTSLARGSSGKLDPARLPKRRTTSAMEPRVRAIAHAFEEVLGITGVGPDDDVVALGGDSLGALQIAATAQLCGVAIDAAAVMAARTPTAIARAQKAQPRTVAALDALAERLATELEPGSAASARGEEWLVTGATGFLGRHLLAELLARTSARIHCVVRAANDAEARLRLGTLGENARIVAHAGDVSAHRFGLGEAPWHELARRVGHVLHAAASLSLSLPFAALEATNVRGTLEVARFVLAGHEKALHQVSSLAVLASTDLLEERLDEWTRAGPEVRVFGPYAQTKWVSETFLRSAVPDLQIVRPGLLTAHSRTALSSRACPLASFIRSVARLGCLPVADDEALLVDVTPVDYAARAIAEAVTSRTRPPILHVASERGASLADLLRAMRRHTAIERVSRDQFLRRARARLTKDDALALIATSFRLLGTDEQRAADLFLHTGRSFPCVPLAELSGRSEKWVDVDDDLLSRYVARARADER